MIKRQSDPMLSPDPLQIFLFIFFLGLRPHATQGTQPPIKFNALFTIKNKKERFVNAEKVYLRVRGWG